jgi:hypothetical protein
MGRATDNLKRGWKRLVEFHQTRFIGNLTKEDYEASFKDHFDRAKALSDFIGMIVRFSFANFAWAYFLRRAPEFGGIRSFALGLCFVFAFGIWAA